MKFLELHYGNGDKTTINFAKVENFDSHSIGSEIWLSSGERVRVTESPEQIAELLGKAGPVVRSEVSHG